MLKIDTIDALRSRGFRMTRQRRAIMDTVQREQRHLTAEEIACEVGRREPQINRATLYRTLRWLCDVGLLRSIDMGDGRRRYEAPAEHEHHHLICRECGAELEIEEHVVQVFQAHIREHYDFDADGVHLALWGRCSACRHASSQ